MNLYLFISGLMLIASINMFIMTIIEKNDIKQMLDEIKKFYNY